MVCHMGAIQVLRNTMGGGGVSFRGEKCYEGVRFNVISLNEGVGGGQIPWKKALRNTWMAPYLFLLDP